MKLIKKKLAILLVLTGLLFPLFSIAQVPPPPPPQHGETGNVPGGGAPIGSGLLILLGIGSLYGGYKGYRVYQDKKKLND